MCGDTQPQRGAWIMVTGAVGLGDQAMSGSDTLLAQGISALLEGENGGCTGDESQYGEQDDGAAA